MLVFLKYFDSFYLRQVDTREQLRQLAESKTKKKEKEEKRKG